MPFCKKREDVNEDEDEERDEEGSKMDVGGKESRAGVYIISSDEPRSRSGVAPASTAPPASRGRENHPAPRYTTPSARVGVWKDR